MSLELLEEIELEFALLHELLDRYGSLFKAARERTPDETEKLALAGILSSFYGGIENLFKRIAIHVDGGAPRGESWHQRLLDAMARPTNNRGKVISENLRQRLKRFLGFRHFYRHAYVFKLKWEKMADHVLQCEQTLALLETELNRFTKDLT